MKAVTPRSRCLESFLLLLALSAAGLVMARGARAGVQIPRASLQPHERQFLTLAVHDSNFVAMSRTSARVNCEATQPPEALATPDPLLDVPGLNSKITVSLIVGVDGRVHSPFILQSLGPSDDRIVLNAVRAWRYRPATCNGVPTDAEAKIAFSSR